MAKLHEPPTPPKRPDVNQGMSERGFGVFAIVGGCVLIYLGIVSPILSAMHHEDEVSISMLLAGIGPLSLIIGLVYTILGDSTAKYLGPRQCPSALGYVFYFVLFIIGTVVYLGVRSVVRSYGYDA